MKKLIALSLIFAAGCKTLSAAPSPLNPWESPSQDLRVINVCNLSENDLQEITQGLHPEMAVEFSSQTVLPVGFFLKGDFAELIENDQPRATLQILQTFYVRFVKDDLIVSTDLTNWKSLLEFITGNASTVLSIQNGRPTISIGAEAYQRS